MEKKKVTEVFPVPPGCRILLHQTQMKWCQTRSPRRSRSGPSALDGGQELAYSERYCHTANICKYHKENKNFVLEEERYRKQKVASR
jgi:hypothetical protein